MKVLLVVDVKELANKEIFEKHLKKEGFNKIEGEDFAYQGDSPTPVMHTRAFIFEIVSKALQKSPASYCALMCQIGDNTMESYVYDEKTKFFNEIK